MQPKRKHGGYRRCYYESLAAGIGVICKDCGDITNDIIIICVLNIACCEKKNQIQIGHLLNCRSTGRDFLR
jgi:hypothetical protein